MKKYAFAGIGVAVGFVSALALFPAAQGATNVLSAYRELDLFGDAFERVRANYVREVDDSELINSAINGMVSSLDPCAMAMILMLCLEIAVKIRPASPEVPRMPSPTTAINPTFVSTCSGLR